MKKILLFLIGIFAFILWFYYIDPKETWQGIKTVDLSYLFLGYAFFFISHFLKILRWGLILEKIRKVPFVIVCKYYWASIFINTFYYKLTKRRKGIGLFSHKSTEASV